MKIYYIVATILYLITLSIFVSIYYKIKEDNEKLWDELSDQHHAIYEINKKTQEKLLCNKNIRAEIIKNEIIIVSKKYYCVDVIIAKEKLKIGEVVKVNDERYYKVNAINRITDDRIEYIAEEI